MKRSIICAILAATSVIAVAQKTIIVSVSNPSNEPRTDQPVVLPLGAYGDVRSALVKVDGQEIPCQLDDLNQDEGNSIQ